jgi:CHAT domain-containing protein
LSQNGIETLVFVPDGALRNIPLAALHDGRRFVVERWAVATALGLSLLDTRPLASRDVNVLLGGITESVQGFTPLPGVEREMEALTRILQPERTLVDGAFVEPALESSLARTPFNIIHLATHGEFTGDPDNSFVLTYDGRLDMDELERLVKLSQFRDQPVDLLTLSACKTAAGDDRSALGLAGLAVKVGARSALATLWELDDESAVAMTTGFYRSLLEPGVDKAEALRRAQLPLLSSPDTRHPFYWAPFLLIGNWQ